MSENGLLCKEMPILLFNSRILCTQMLEYRTAAKVNKVNNDIINLDIYNKNME